MGEHNLCRLPLDETLVAGVSQLLNSDDVLNVLCGNFLLTVYRIPSLTNSCLKKSYYTQQLITWANIPFRDALFIVPDDLVLHAQKILEDAGLQLCSDPELYCHGSLILTSSYQPLSSRNPGHPSQKKDYQCPLDLHYLGCATYMIEYAYPGGYFDLNSLQPVFREFLVDGFLKNSMASFVAARERWLMASEI